MTIIQKRRPGRPGEKRNFLLGQKELAKWGRTSMDNADCFFFRWWIVYYEFVPRGQSVNRVFDKYVLTRRCVKNIYQKNGEQVSGFFTATTHQHIQRVLSIREFSADKKVPVVLDPYYYYYFIFLIRISA